MATQVQLRRGTTAQHASFTGAVGEITVDTDKKVTVVHDGVTAGGFPGVQSSAIQTQEFVYIGTIETGSTADAILLSATPSLSGGYTAGMKFAFVPDSNNTGSVTVNIDSQGAVTLKKNDGGTLANLEADDLVAGVYYEITRIGSFFQVNGGGLGGGSIKPLTSITVAGGESTLDFDALFTSGKNYRFEFFQIKPSADAVFRARTSNDGGSTWLSGTNDYRHSSIYSTDGGAVTGVGGPDTLINLSASISLGSVSISTDEEGMSGTLKIFNPADTTQKQCKMTWQLNVHDGNGQQNIIIGCGIVEDVANGQSPNSLQFFLSTGTFTTGTIVVYEEDAS